MTDRTQDPPRERRRPQRHVYTLPCTIVDPRGHESRARTINISQGGVSLELFEPPDCAVDSVVTIRIHGVNPIDARVRWIEEHRIGTEFDAPVAQGSELYELFRRLSG